jgi:hypothetical protein
MSASPLGSTDISITSIRNEATMKTARSLRFLWATACAALIVLSACSTIGGPRTITFTDADMARMLEQHGPFQKRLLEVLDVRVNRPTVRLLPQTNRLSSDLDVVTTERMSGKTYSGKISVDYSLRYDESVQAIRMTQVQVNRLSLDNLPSPEKTGLGRLGGLIAEQLLNDAVVYRFKPADLKSAEGRGYKPGAVTVTSRGVEITLVPIDR